MAYGVEADLAGAQIHTHLRGSGPVISPSWSASVLVTQCDQGRARGGTGKLYSGEEQVGSGRTFRWNLEEPGGITQVKHGMGG